MDLASKKCVPCEVGTPPMAKTKAESYLSEVKGWELVDDSGKLKIKKKFQFSNYMAGVDFVNQVAKIAEAEGHHPDLYLGYQRVTVNLMTHAIGGLSENDFVMAAKIDQIK
ncbi:4a-hydroxytetrahydrobiopterin dehydratase [Candidatus Curtissbacteria bacterium]|nr:4a-hydroxytetrahydrobiopterin dehydratase [Candidatus Curtissbacteria bacterium]